MGQHSSVLEQLVELPMEGAVELTEFRATPHKFATQLRSLLGGAWRAYLPGSRYNVRIQDNRVTVKRTG
jgi:hypothetical protein